MILVAAFSLAPMISRAQTIADSLPWRHAISMHGEPALPPGYSHMPHVNPNAPRAGRLVQAQQGTFDSLNPFVVRGVAPDLVPRYILQSLLHRSPDEPFTAYALLADGVQLPDDRRWVSFRIDPRARFADGAPVTPEDVKFSYEMLRTKGKPFHRGALGRVTGVTTPDSATIRFELGEGQDRELPLIIGLMPVFAKHATDPEKFAETSFTAPLGSGPYAVSELKPGESITLTRRGDYWGLDHPQARGQFNFDEIKTDFYRDSNALFEAFKAGLYDFRIEPDPTRWATGYDFPAIRDGRVVREQLRLNSPKGMSGLVFNSRRAQFQDARVREALGFLFDFRWINTNLFHGSYRRGDSFFADSELSSHGRAADAGERSLLAPFSSAVREDVMAGQWSPPQTDGSGRDRQLARKAIALLGEAGFALRDGVMRNKASGAALSFEITVSSRQQERLALNYAQSLMRIGVIADVRLIDDVQYWRRLAGFDFDMIQWLWPVSASPGNEQSNRWGATAAERQGSLNYAGAKSPAIDAMIAAMLAARSREEFVSAVRALDRVLLSGHYVVPLFYVPNLWLARHRDIRLPERRAAFAFTPEALWRETPAKAASAPVP
ncbi:MAG: extracellular solute-binding protein [Bosea sp. (in: a-proteobacteria)]